MLKALFPVPNVPSVPLWPGAYNGKFLEDDAAPATAEAFVVLTYPCTQTSLNRQAGATW